MEANLQSPVKESPSNSEPTGMSDEEELRRWTNALNNAMPVEEEVVNLAEELRNLGIES